MRSRSRFALLVFVALFCLGVTIDYYLEGPELGLTEAAGDKSCAAGDYKLFANSTSSKIRKCENGTISDMDTTGGGGGAGYAEIVAAQLAGY